MGKKIESGGIKAEARCMDFEIRHYKNGQILELPWDRIEDLENIITQLKERREKSNA